MYLSFKIICIYFIMRWITISNMEIYFNGFRIKAMKYMAEWLGRRALGSKGRSRVRSLCEAFSGENC